MLPIKNGLMSVKAGMNKDQTIGDTFKSLANSCCCKKIISLGEIIPFGKVRVDFRSASVLSRGRPMSRFSHLRSLQGLISDAKSPKSDAGSSPINHSAKCLYFFNSSIVIKSPIICIHRGDKLLFSMWRSDE